MSEHVAERLSAYLDGELRALERAAVESHLAGCDECARRLETLAAVDAAVRALPAQAPAGYFDEFPARVRRRIEAPRPAVWHPPAWAWAAAAVFVLAVLTPRLLQEARVSPEVPAALQEGREQAAGRADVSPIPSAAAPAQAPAAPPAAARPFPQKGGGRRRDAENAPAAAATVPSTVDLAESRSELLGEAAALPEPTPPPARGEANLQATSRGAATAERERTADEAQERLSRHVRDGSPKARAPVAAPPPSEAPKPAETAGFAAPAASEPAPSISEQLVVEAEPSMLGAGDAAKREKKDPEGEYAALAGRVSRSAPGARALREAWRGYSLRYPAGAHADEARVRVIEAGAAAVRLGRDPGDQEILRRDAAAYLARKDSAQADRVRAVLREMERRP